MGILDAIKGLIGGFIPFELTMEHLIFFGTISFAALLLGIIILWLLYQTFPILPFLDANARLSARTNFIVRDKKLQELIDKKSLPEFINALQNTQYFEKISKSKTVDEIHSGIERSFIESIEEIREISPGNFQNVISSYLSIYEAKIIKTFYRSRFYENSMSLHESMLFSVGIITKPKLEELMKTKTVQDAAVVLANTKYYEILKKDYKSINEFETELDTFVFREFVNNVKKVRTPFTMPVLKIINSKFDILNILLILKYQKRNIPIEKRAKLLIQNQSPLYSKIESAVASKNPEELYDFLKGTIYDEPYKEALERFKKDSSTSHFEYTLMKSHYNFVIRNELIYPQGPYPIIAYLSRKEAEKSNLLLLSKALFADIPESKIREMIV